MLSFRRGTWIAQGPVCCRSFYQQRAGPEHTEHLETARLTCPWGFVADLAVATRWTFPSPMTTTTMTTMRARWKHMYRFCEQSPPLFGSCYCDGMYRWTTDARTTNRTRVLIRLLGIVRKYLMTGEADGVWAQRKPLTNLRFWLQEIVKS